MAYASELDLVDSAGLAGPSVLAGQTPQGWKRPFDNPIVLPDGRALVTLQDAGDYITMLPKADQQLDEWQTAIECLMPVVKLGGPTMFARIGMLRALNRHVERVFGPSRKDKHWGTPPAGAGSMTDIPRKPFGGKGTMDGYRCELCGAWIEYRNLSKVLAHEGPLPHVEQDRLAGENGNDCDRKKPPRR